MCENGGGWDEVMSDLPLYSYQCLKENIPFGVIGRMYYSLSSTFQSSMVPVSDEKLHPIL